MTCSCRRSLRSINTDERKTMDSTQRGPRALCFQGATRPNDGREGQNEMDTAGDTFTSFLSTRNSDRKLYVCICEHCNQLLKRQTSGNQNLLCVREHVYVRLASGLTKTDCENKQTAACVLFKESSSQCFCLFLDLVEHSYFPPDLQCIFISSYFS